MHSAAPVGLSAFRTFFQRFGRWLLLALGVGAIVYLVESVGPRAVWASLVGAGPWLPLVLLLDLAWLATEGLALLALYGGSARKIPLRDWVEATLVQYTTMVVLPVGRAGAEVARASMLSRFVGGTRATAAAALMQSITLLANAAVSVVCLAFVLLGPRQLELALLLLGNAAVTLVLGAGMYLVMRRAKVGGMLGRRFERLAHFGPELDEHFAKSRSRHFAALGICLGGRVVQTLQYGVILYAVTSVFTVQSTFVAQGIHLVGAGLGDMVPNQVGVTEGAYRIFAGALGLAAEPERAVAVALLARVSNLGVAGLCALGVQLLPRRQKRARDGALGS
jgi:hypothetical protein